MSHNLANLDRRHEEAIFAKPQADAGSQQERQQIRQEQRAEPLAWEDALVAHFRVTKTETVTFRWPETPVLRRLLIRTTAPIVKEFSILRYRTFKNNKLWRNIDYNISCIAFLIYLFYHHVFWSTLSRDTEDKLLMKLLRQHLLIVRARIKSLCGALRDPSVLLMYQTYVWRCRHHLQRSMIWRC